MEQHVVGGAAGDRVDGDADRAGDLADAVETGDVAWLGAQMLGEPGGRHDADAVLGGLAARARQQARADEPVDLLEAQTRRRRSRRGRFRRPARPAADRRGGAPGCARSRRWRPCCSPRICRSPAELECRYGHAGREVLESDDDGVAHVQFGVRRRRAAGRSAGALACSTSSTSTSTNGRSSSKPGKNAWRTTVHDRTVPRPLTGVNSKRGIAAAAMRTHHIGRHGELTALSAARHGEDVLGRGRPERRRRLVGDRKRAFGHGMTPCSISFEIRSQS